MILGAFDIKYMPRIAVKGQVLADLVAEFIEYLTMIEPEEQELGGEQISTISIHRHPSWKLYVDGATNQRETGVEVIIVSLDGITIEKSLRLFQPLIMKLGGKIVEVFSDSRLVVRKIKGELDAKDHKMQGYLGKAWQLQSSFESFSI